MEDSGTRKAPGPRSGTVTRAQFLALFSAVFLPMFMAAVDQTLLATATPAIAASLGGLRDASWIAVGYLLAAATVVPVYGQLGDQRGRREMLLAALGVFALGSAACAASQSLPQLVAARILQGLGGGGLMTLSQALIGELVPPRERVRFQGYFAIVFTTSSVAGPVLGGVVVSHVSWRWLFVANLPLAAFAAWRLLRLPQGERHPPRRKSADVAGQLLFAVASVSTLFWLTSAGNRFAWSAPESLVLATIGAASIAALYLHERRQAAPFIPLDLLRQATIGRSTLLVALFAICLFALIFFLPIYLQLGHRMSAQASGLLLLPVTAGMVASATVSSRVLARTGRPRWIPVSGMALAAAALVLLGTLPPGPTLITVLGFAAGAGLGTVMPTTQVTVQTVAGRARLGAVTALVALARSTGGAAGAALFGAVVFALMPGTLAEVRAGAMDPADEHVIVEAFHLAFLATAAVAALAALVASRIPPITLWKRH
ncbi:MAG TPA: MFS transporter [Burkholderiales bacterium]|nr:MFS transporter [Burkholderiales bacterium]